MNDGLNKTDLQLLVKADAIATLIASPLMRGHKTVWALDVVLKSGETVMVTRARRKDEHRIWKQLSAVHRFIRNTAPKIDKFTVMLRHSE